MTARIAALVPTPVYTVAVPDAVPLSRALARIILDQQAAQRGVSKSNVGGWQSDIDLLRWGGEPAHALAAACVAAADRVTADAAGASHRILWRPEMWANINRRGDSNQNHWHPGSYLSFVYYVDDGYQGSVDRALGGELVFVDPRMPFLRMRSPNLRHRTAAGTIEEQETWVRPFSGLLIGFPSFVLHSVRPYGGAGTRISIAINLVARPT